MHEARFVAMDLGTLAGLNAHVGFDEAAEHAGRLAERNALPYAVVRVVGEVRVVKEVKVDRFDQEADHARP